VPINIETLPSLLKASDRAFDIQNKKRNELYNKIKFNYPVYIEFKTKEGFDGVFVRAYEKLDDNERELYNYILSLTVNTFYPINNRLLEWINKDAYFKGQWNDRGIRGDLSRQLSDLETHLLLWIARYKALNPEITKHPLVYLDDEKKFGPGFPQELNDAIEENLIEGGWSKELISTISKQFRYNQGLILFYLRQFNGALDAFDKAIEKDKNYAKAWYGKANCMVKLKRGNEANDLFKRSSNFWYIKGKSLFESEKYREAIKVLDKATGTNKEHLAAWLLKGKAYYELVMYEEAIIAFDMSIKIKQNLEAWQFKAKALAKLGRKYESKEANDKAHELENDREKQAKNQK
jgi:tetratricopeptide (TPR) repeat protein